MACFAPLGGPTISTRCVAQLEAATGPHAYLHCCRERNAPPPNSPHEIGNSAALPPFTGREAAAGSLGAVERERFFRRRARHLLASVRHGENGPRCYVLSRWPSHCRCVDYASGVNWQHDGTVHCDWRADGSRPAAVKCGKDRQSGRSSWLPYRRRWKIAVAHSCNPARTLRHVPVNRASEWDGSSMFMVMTLANCPLKSSGTLQRGVVAA
jgi:hypothetical protein